MLLYIMITRLFSLHFSGLLEHLVGYNVVVDGCVPIMKLKINIELSFNWLSLSTRDYNLVT